MKKDRYVEATIEATSRRLKKLARNIDLSDLEKVKESLKEASSEILEVT